jgi:hypothetical protein
VRPPPQPPRFYGRQAVRSTGVILCRGGIEFGREVGQAFEGKRTGMPAGCVRGLMGCFREALHVGGSCKVLDVRRRVVRRVNQALNPDDGAPHACGLGRGRLNFVRAATQLRDVATCLGGSAAHRFSERGDRFACRK